MVLWINVLVIFLRYTFNIFLKYLLSWILFAYNRIVISLHLIESIYFVSKKSSRTASVCLNKNEKYITQVSCQKLRDNYKKQNFTLKNVYNNSHSSYRKSIFYHYVSCRCNASSVTVLSRYVQSFLIHF